MIILNVLLFTVEFLKTYIASAGIFKIKQKRKVFFFYLAAVLLLTTLTVFRENMNRSVLFVILTVFTLCLNAAEYRKIWMIPVIYIVVSMLDILNSLVFIRCLGLTMEQIQGNIFLYTAINSVTLIGLLVIYGVLRKKNREEIHLPTPAYASLYILGGGASLIYLTCAQLSMMNEYKAIYHNLWLGGLICSGIIFLIIGGLLFHKTGENEYLKREQDMNRKILDAQANYYTLLLEKNKEIRAFRHDIKNHLYCMTILGKQGQYGELQEYLEKISHSLERTGFDINTGNEMVSAILNDLSCKYKEVHCEWHGKLQSPFTLSNYDICTIFYNLLCNAFEAAEKTKQKEITVQVKYLNDALYVVIQNYFEQNPVKEKGVFISSKTEGDHGFGIENAKMSIEQNGGVYEARVEGNQFITEIIIPEMNCETTVLG